MFEKHARKGRLVYVDGKLQTRRWSKPGEDSDRYSTEILLVPGGRVQFLDKPNGNGAPAPADAAMQDTATAQQAADVGRRHPVLGPSASFSSHPGPAPRASIAVGTSVARRPPHRSGRAR